MKENRMQCFYLANNYCNLSLQPSCLWFSNCSFAPTLSEIGITFSLDDFQQFRQLLKGRTAGLWKTFYSKVLGSHRIQPWAHCVLIWKAMLMLFMTSFQKENTLIQYWGFRVEEPDRFQYLLASLLSQTSRSQTEARKEMGKLSQGHKNHNKVRSAEHFEFGVMSG